MGAENYKNPPAWRAFMSLRVAAVRIEIHKLGTLIVTLFLLYEAAAFSRWYALGGAAILLLVRAVEERTIAKAQSAQAEHIANDADLSL